jgi:acyl-coenzyme A thioesterase PaaI-like protein
VTGTVDWIRAIEIDPTLTRLPTPPNRERNWVHGNPEGRRIDVRYYADTSGQRLFGIASFGADCEGPPGSAHGGAIASLIDDAMGTTAWTAGHRVFTLTVTVNMRAFVPLGVPVRVECAVERVDGRKVTVACRVVSPPETVHADATGLFLQPRPAAPSEP